MTDTIIVLTTEGDPSSSEVIHWIKRLGGNVTRINNLLDLQEFVLKHPDVMFLGASPSKYDRTLIRGIWYRRHPALLPLVAITNTSSDIEMGKLFTTEQKAFFDAFCELHKDNKWLNRHYNSRISKISQLIEAKTAGLDFPESRIISSKNEITKFQSKNIIIKPIQDVSHIHINGEPYTQYTTVCTKKMIDQLNDTFFPCLCQKFIDKNLEIRTFFLDGEMYSMGICSTFDEQTKIDFRRYNRKHPNRVIPYQLPDHIEKKIKLLMRNLSLNCGSLDLILGNDGRYYFLEVNPVGQFGMVSKPCNYYLESAIAKFLIR